MTTTPGYTVDALLQAVREEFTRAEGMGWLRSPLSIGDHIVGIERRASEITGTARAAELTQVTAQSVERASPAKDGGEQVADHRIDRSCDYSAKALKQAIDEVFTRYSAMYDSAVARRKYNAPSYKAIVDAIQEIADRAADLSAQPLASQMRPQSAVQGWVLVPVELTNEMLLAALKELDPIGELIDWDGPDCTQREDLLLYWKTMLAAAPSYSDAS